MLNAYPVTNQALVVIDQLKNSTVRGTADLRIAILTMIYKRRDLWEKQDLLKLKIRNRIFPLFSLILIETNSESEKSIERSLGCLETLDAFRSAAVSLFSASLLNWV